MRQGCSNAFPPADGGFCCDQTALYDPSRDLTFWLLQYIEQGGANTLRVAVKRGATLGDSDWYWWDFRPAQVSQAWQGEWFDYNHAALSNDNLYVASNAFRDNDWTRAVVFRLPLDDLAGGQGLSYDYFQTTENGSLRCTQGAQETMYFASHNRSGQIRIFSWPEDATAVTQIDVDVSPWDASNYNTPGPDGNEWLSRCDDRMTGAWVARGVIGVMWSAGRLGDARPFPYARVVRLDESSKAVIDEPDIWNRGYAYAYPDACPNDRGDVGITVFRGGGARHPGHIVGAWDNASRRWMLQGSRNGTNGPSDRKWGDYLTCRRHSPDGLSWLAAGFTLQGGSTLNEVQPCVVHFGLSRYRNAAERWAGSGPAGGGAF
jgi:hypothetical protein